MKRPLWKRLPKEQFNLIMRGDRLEIHALCNTTYELDAVVEALLIMRDDMSSAREAVDGDIGTCMREPTYADQVYAFLGPTPVPEEHHND